MVKAYEVVNHMIDTGEIFSTLTYLGKSFHISNQSSNEKGTKLVYINVDSKDTVEIFIPHSIDDKLLIYRRLRNDIEDAIELNYNKWEEKEND